MSAPSATSKVVVVLYWVTTLVILYELTAGAIWNLVPIEWITVQLEHLGYPPYLAYILGVWQVGAAAAIAAPGFPLIKEWAYAGSFFLWSGAVVSHLVHGDTPDLWGVPLTFGVCAIVSWALRPASRRLPQTQLRRYRPADNGPAGESRARSFDTGRRAWIVSIGLLVVMYATSGLALPIADSLTHDRAVQLGWIEPVG